MTKQTIKFAAAVMTTLLALLMLWQFRTAVIYVLLSLLLAAALRPLINHLVGRGLVARIAWILGYLVVMAAFIFVFFLSGDLAIQEIRLTDSLSTRDVWNLPGWLAGGSLTQALVAQLPAPSQIFEAVAGAFARHGFAIFPIFGVNYFLNSWFRNNIEILAHLCKQIFPFAIVHAI